MDNGYGTFEHIAAARIAANVAIDIYAVSDPLRPISSRRQHNLVTDSGRALLRELIAGWGYRPSHCAVGTDSTETSASDSALGQEVYRALISRRTDIDGSEIGLKIETLIPADACNGETLTECALLETGLQNGTAGDPARLFARAVFEPIAKTSLLTLTVNWSLTIAAV